MIPEYLRQRLQELPGRSGVYLFKDREGKVILTHESSARSYESNLLFLMGVVRQGERDRESKGVDTYIKAMNGLLAFIAHKKSKLLREASVAA